MERLDYNTLIAAAIGTAVVIGLIANNPESFKSPVTQQQQQGHNK